MENELVCSKDFYLLAIDIFKMLSLQANNRNIDGRNYLDEKYQIYIKLVENSALLRRKINDSLTPSPIMLLNGSQSGSDETV